MATVTSPLVNISLSAADHILALGVWTPFRAMLERTTRATPGLRSITVSLDDSAGLGESIIRIVGETDQVPHEEAGADPEQESTDWQWERWASETLPPDVLRHFCMMTIPVDKGAIDER
ncbi:MAG: hypothetical protein ABI353_22140 [Isosphaeraceae bacterium]